MKRSLLSEQFSDQFFGPINRDLIVYREQYSSTPLNLCVEFDALIAHRTPLELRQAEGACASSHRCGEKADGEGEQHEAAECVDRYVYRIGHWEITRLGNGRFR